jgi:hypothetical protein
MEVVVLEEKKPEGGVLFGVGLFFPAKAAHKHFL